MMPQIKMREVWAVVPGNADLKKKKEQTLQAEGTWGLCDVRTGCPGDV